MKNNNPKISVVMSAYNRPEYSKIAIESILNQTYKDFEFIIFDNGSTDNTTDIIKEFAENDDRIVFIRNDKGVNYTLNLIKGMKMAKGEYIARMDDDDISMPARFEKQVEYLDKHKEVIVLGTYIKTFGYNPIGSWVNMSDPDEIDVAINFLNPICHPTVMIRKDFIEKYNIEFKKEELYAEDYRFWADVILKGGKVANLAEPLLNYRIHQKSATQTSKSQKLQDESAERTRQLLLRRFYKNNYETTKTRESIIRYPFENNNKKQLSNALEAMKKFPKIISRKAIEKFEEKYIAKENNMNIFFSSSNEFSKYLAVCITSILKNALPKDKFNFYILDGGIKEYNKKKIESLKKIKDFKIEFIKVDESLFENCPTTNDCKYIAKQTYYRYVIPKIKPELDKVLYLDCDIVVEDSLSELWNIDLKDNYAAAVEEFWTEAHKHYLNIGIEKSFNAGVMLFNNKKCVLDNISEKLFKTTVMLQQKNILRWEDQDTLNYLFNNKVEFTHPKFNLQQTAYFESQHSLYSDLLMNHAKQFPIIIHYSGHLKPWDKTCWHPLWREYYKYLKISPYKNEYYKYKFKKILKEIGKIFYRKKISANGAITKTKILGLTIFKKEYRDYKIKKRLFGIKIFEKFLQRDFINDRVGNLNYDINRQYDEISKTLNEVLQNQRKVIDDLQNQKSLIDCRLNQRELKYNILKDEYDLIIRDKTSDISVFYQVFVDENYDYPYHTEPKIIFDMGANVGYTAIYYAKRFPNAKIYCLEPDIDNYNILLKNTEKYSNITTLHGALYSKDTTLNVYNPGLGAWGMQVSEKLNNTNNTTKAYCFETLLKLWNLENVTIDILKIDIEGSEKELFENNTDFLNNVELLIVETHDRYRPGTSQAIFKAMKDKDYVLNVKGEDLVFESKNYHSGNLVTK